ncbi:heparan-alpha-glucosaminide N-acetyltransferase [Brevipalpus obovatus]|uniref:heparan-alpha-glucosaminide N-acetyltransferase n=1 Tax=Brevipalpus obovatus TaxID=246614 RepID=UPI003D9E2CFA
MMFGDNLPLDKALLKVHNYDPIEEVSLWYQIEDCHDCSLIMAGSILPNSNITTLIDTKYRVTLQARRFKDEAKLCTIPYRWFGDQGEYLMKIRQSVNETSGWMCKISNTDIVARNNFYPILAVLAFYIFISALWFLKRRFFRKHSVNSSLRSNRLKSLDAFRGMTIILMIFVNYGGGGYEFFEHKPWFGLTLADCVFPWFILIMGISLSLSIQSRVKKGFKTFPLWCDILSRSLKLFLIGLCLNSNRSYLSSLRIPGVLQRFGLSYFFVASFRLLSCTLYQRKYAGTEDDDNPPNRVSKRKKLLIYIPEIFLYSTCIIIYGWTTLFWKYSETCPPGYQGPGGLHKESSYFNCTGGAANFIDRTILGQDHMYKRATSTSVYKNQIPHDPEGILGTTMSILLTGLGAIAGDLLIRVNNARSRILWWSLMSFILGLLTLILSRASIIPICKNLWSFTFITSTGALGLIIFASFHWFIDIWGIWKQGKPLIYPGMNSIVLYVGHMVTAGYFPFYFGVDNTSHYQLLFRDLVGVNLWLIISFLMAKRKIFITL